MNRGVRTYRQPVPRFWWVKRRSYLLFMLRELSCVFVAWSVVYLLLLVHAVSGGQYSYARFLAAGATPATITLSIVTLIFLLLHTVTWFALAPRAMVIHLLGRRVQPRAVLAGHYAAWVVVSVVLLWLVLA
jgi:fumarate reductase subunit C